MNQQNDYQFVMIPQQLSSCLDANCHKMLSTLLGLHSLLSNEDGWFFRSNKDLQLDVRLSENVVRATLDTLYQAGIINIDCIGKGKGHRTNRIHINFESFKVYQQYSFNDIRNNPNLWIETVKYKDHFVPSYMKKSEEICERKCEELCECICEKVSTNTDTTNTSNTINKIYNINNIIKEDAMMVKPVIDIEDNLREEERNLVIQIENKPCSKKELENIYKNNFGELLSNYPNLNYNLIKTNNFDSFYECYSDVVNEYLLRVRQNSQRNITKEEFLKTFLNYLNFIEYSYQ